MIDLTLTSDEEEPQPAATAGRRHNAARRTKRLSPVHELGIQPPAKRRKIIALPRSSSEPEAYDDDELVAGLANFRQDGPPAVPAGDRVPVFEDFADDWHTAHREGRARNTSPPRRASPTIVEPVPVPGSGPALAPEPPVVAVETDPLAQVLEIVPDVGPAHVEQLLEQFLANGGVANTVVQQVCPCRALERKRGDCSFCRSSIISSSTLTILRPSVERSASGIMHQTKRPRTMILSQRYEFSHAHIAPWLTMASGGSG